MQEKSEQPRLASTVTEIGSQTTRSEAFAYRPSPHLCGWRLSSVCVLGLVLELLAGASRLLGPGVGRSSSSSTQSVGGVMKAGGGGPYNPAGADALMSADSN